MGVFRHDKLYINNAIFYFLSERQCATEFHELHPGVVSELPAQNRIINALEKNKVQFIVLTDEHNANEPNLSSISSGLKTLDNYIRNNFYKVTSFGEYYIFKRRLRFKCLIQNYCFYTTFESVQKFLFLIILMICSPKIFL